MAFKIPSISDLINPTGALNSVLGRGAGLGDINKKLESGFEDLTGTSAVREAKKKDEEAAKAQQAALDALLNIPQSNYTAPEYSPYEYLGDYSPQLLQDLEDLGYSESDIERITASTAGPSAYNDIQLDPRLLEDQYAALDALKELAKGGLNEQDKANLAKIQTQENAADRGRREAIQQNMAARGFSGSGQDLLAQLASGQAATDRASQRGMDIAAMMEQRALDAIMKGSNLAGDIETRKFGQEAQKAAAEDAIRKFNAQQTQGADTTNAGAYNDQVARIGAGNLEAGKHNQNRTMGVNTTNVNAINTAGLAGHTDRQKVANANTDVTNAAKDKKLEIEKQKYRDLLDLKALQSGQYSQGAERSSTRAGQEAAAGGAIRGAIVGAAAQAGAAAAGKK